MQQWRRLTGPNYSPYIFPNHRNTSVYLKSIRKPWVAALKKAEIAYFPAYCLRATFASRLAAAGVPDVFVSQLMGHAGGLLQTYAKAITEYRRDAIRNWKRSGNLPMQHVLPLFPAKIGFSDAKRKGRKLSCLL